MQLSETVTDDTLRELYAHGTKDFPFAYYYEDTRKYNQGYIEWHWHREFEWVYVERGTLECRIGLERILLYPGDGIFINSKSIHRLESENGAIIPNILFMPELLAPRDASVYQRYVSPILLSGCPYRVFRREEEGCRQVLPLLRGVFAAAQCGTELDVQIAVLTLWRTFFHSMEEPFLPRGNRKDMLLQARALAMVQFIEDHYQKKISLEQIAQAGGVSKSEALRCFHSMFQSTPVQFLIRYRLNRARELLLSAECTVTQAAIESGIENVSYFIRIFAKQFGVTPKKFIQQHRK